jgi:tripartite motif-containing protein 71
LIKKERVLVINNFIMSNIFLYSFGKVIEDELNGFHPVGITSCDDNIFVCDLFNHRVKVFKFEPLAQIDLQSKFKLLTSSMSPFDLQSKLTNKGEFLFSFGKCGRGEGEFYEPEGITCDKDGNIIVSDTGNDRIQVFNSQGKFLFSFGKYGEEEGQFIWPVGITCDKDGNIVVCDNGNHRVQIFSPKGQFIRKIGSFGEEDGQFESPEGVTCDHDGNIIVADTRNHRIQVFTSKGEFLFSFGSEGEEEGQFVNPRGVTCDHDGNIIVSDSGNHRIQIFKLETSKMSPIGLQDKLKCEPMSTIDLQSKFTYKFLHSFGKKGKEEGDFDIPKGIACNHQGDYIICDFKNNRIQVFKGPTEVPTLLSLCLKHVEKIILL